MPFSLLLISLITDRTPSSSNDQVATYNRYLWEASLLLVKDYSLSVVDSGGGYIETDWIIQGIIIDVKSKYKLLAQN